MSPHGRKYGDKDSYPICVWNGIFEHRQKIGLAVWEFLWCLDKITVEKDGIGWVFGKTPVRVAQIAQNLNICEKSVRNHLNRLKASGYISTKKSPFGLIIGVNNSRKIWAASSRDSDKKLPVLSTGSGKPFRETAQALPEELAKNYRSKEDKAVDKAIDEGEGATALDFPTPWKVLGSDLPMGGPRFQKIFEHYFGSRNGNSLSDAMERAIQRANKCGVRVPRPFFEAKRVVERREAAELAAPKVAEMRELEVPAWAN